jgi:hypothetical protein
MQAEVLSDCEPVSGGTKPVGIKREADTGMIVCILGPHSGAHPAVAERSE